MESSAEGPGLPEKRRDVFPIRCGSRISTIIHKTPRDDPGAKKRNERRTSCCIAAYRVGSHHQLSAEYPHSTVVTIDHWSIFPRIGGNFCKKRLFLILKPWFPVKIPSPKPKIPKASGRMHPGQNAIPGNWGCGWAANQSRPCIGLCRQAPHRIHQWRELKV